MKRGRIEMVTLDKELYCVCPLYKAKHRYKVADKKNGTKAETYEVLKCKELGRKAYFNEYGHKLYEDIKVEILNNDEQSKYTHHKKLKRNVIKVRVVGTKEKMEEFKRLCESMDITLMGYKYGLF